MQKRFYDKESINKLIVVNKPIFLSSNFYLTRIKKKYKNKKAGFSGTLDPFAKGCLIVAFGQYSKLFKYFSKTPKTYKAVIWLGVESDSLDIEQIIDIKLTQKINEQDIKDNLREMMWSHASIVRDPKTLQTTLDMIEAYLKLNVGRLLFLRLLTAKSILKSALNRKKSLGAHFIKEN